MKYKSAEPVRDGVGGAMNLEVLSLVESLGTELSPSMMQGTQQFFAQRFVGVDSLTSISRDRSYGPHERHRLDVFTKDGRRDAPVLVFVHGGGFVGVTMTYRLAPAHPWPAGSEDVAAAVSWLRTNVAAYGGDPGRIFLLGQSAGAVHVAGYVAHSRLQPDGGSGLAGAMMISGVYDVAAADANQFQRAYYGEEREKWGACSTLDGLAASELPLLFSVSEYDGADFQRQAALLPAAFVQSRGRFPRLHWLAGHNHLSPVLAVGSTVDTLGPLIKDFIETVCR